MILGTSFSTSCTSGRGTCVMVRMERQLLAAMVDILNDAPHAWLDNIDHRGATRHVLRADGLHNLARLNRACLNGAKMLNHRLNDGFPPGDNRLDIDHTPPM